MPKTILFSKAAGASNTNGGMYESPVTFSQCYNTDGSPVSNTTSAAGTNNGSGSVRITTVGAFTSAIAGMYAYVDWAATYTDGWFLITARTNDTIDLSLAYSADATATTVKVGGAFATFTTAETKRANGGDTLKVVPSSVGTPITEKDATGNAILYINTAATGYSIIEGVNPSTGEVDAANLVKLNAATNTAVNCIRITPTAFGAPTGDERMTVRGFECYDCTGVGIGSPVGGFPDRTNLEDCYVHDAGSNGVNADDSCLFLRVRSNDNATSGFECSGGDGLIFENCEASGNVQKGIATQNFAAVSRCTVENNGFYGIQLNGAGMVDSCVVRNNGTSQIRVNYGSITNNLVVGAGELVWMNDQNAPTNMLISQNTLVGTGAAGNVGLELADTIANEQTFIVTRNIVYGCEIGGRVGFLTPAIRGDSNLFFGNATTVSGGTWSDTNRLTSDPLFEDAGAGDYRLGAGSPAYDAATGRTIGARGPVAGGGSSGGCIIG